jgi:hypothetical protein
MQAELNLLRDQHVSDANWRIIEAIDRILNEVVVPLEQMRVSLRTSARSIPASVARAEFTVSLRPLFARTPPMKLYVEDKLDARVVREITFTENGVTAIWLLERLLQKEGMFPHMTRILGMLVNTFPDGNLATELVRTKEEPLSIRFTVSYTLEAPKGVITLS